MHQYCITTRRYTTPCGTLLLGSQAGHLCLCDWQTEKHRHLADKRLRCLAGPLVENGDSPTLQLATTQLDEYFAGQRKSFCLPLLFTGTKFQQRVWQELLHIPYGETISYGRLARRLGIPTATRAVANAVGANTLSIVIPCHRVISCDQRLTGYAGGLDAKRHLLELETMPLLRLMRS